MLFLLVDDFNTVEGVKVKLGIYICLTKQDEFLWRSYADLAVQEFWQVDDNTILCVADPSLGIYVIDCLLLCPLLQTIYVVVSCNYHQLLLLK
jgi:hypothetical protein